MVTLRSNNIDMLEQLLHVIVMFSDHYFIKYLLYQYNICFLILNQLFATNCF